MKHTRMLIKMVKKKYCDRCGRRTNNDFEIMYPLNAWHRLNFDMHDHELCRICEKEYVKMMSNWMRRLKIG